MYHRDVTKSLKAEVKSKNAKTLLLGNKTQLNKSLTYM